MTATTLSEEFANWATGLRFEDLPEPVVGATVQTIRDTLACGVLGAAADRVRKFRPLIEGSPPLASLTGGSRASLIDAAMFNAICVHGCELDDTLLGAGGHPGAVVVPSALALAEANGLGGTALITAVVVGYELMYRSVAPIFPSNQHRGFQATGLGGPFAAAAAVGSLLDLTSDQLANAFGIAGSYSSGLLEYDQTGGESKRLYAGIAARAGIESVLLARSGVTGPRLIFEGRRGVFAAFGAHTEIGLATVDLGRDFSIVGKRRVKRYPTVGSFQGALDAVDQVMDGSFSPDDVERVDVYLAPMSVAHGGAVRKPTDVVSAQFSCAYSVAIRMITGRNDLAFYEDPGLWSDPQVLALVDRITVSADPSLEPAAEQGRGGVVLYLTDGRVRQNDQPVPVGRPDNPLSEVEFDARFELFTRSLGADAVDLDTELRRLTELDSLDRLIRALGAGNHSAKETE